MNKAEEMNQKAYFARNDVSIYVEKNYEKLLEDINCVAKYGGYKSRFELWHQLPRPSRRHYIRLILKRLRKDGFRARRVIGWWFGLDKILVKW